MLIILAGCSDTTCEDYGVRETGISLGTPIEHASTTAQIRETCGPGKSGCWKQEGDSVHIYWIKGDGWAREHERCHAEQGPYHTVEYTQALIQN